MTALKIKKFQGEFPSSASRGRQETPETKQLVAELLRIKGTEEVLEVHGKNAADRDRLASKIRALAGKNRLGVSIRLMDGATGLVFKVPGDVRPMKSGGAKRGPKPGATKATKASQRAR